MIKQLNEKSEEQKLHFEELIDNQKVKLNTQEDEMNRFKEVINFKKKLNFSYS